MASKLKNMLLSSVDLCKRGANPDSQIKLFKRAEALEEGGEAEKPNCIAKYDCYAEIDAMTDALHKSFYSIVEDKTLSEIEKEDKFAESLQEFNIEVAESAANWALATESATSLATMKKSVEKDVLSLEKISLERMSPEDRETLAELEEKYTESELPGTSEKTPPAIHPDVKKAMDEMAELRKSLEISQLEGIAKKYESLGKKPTELAGKLYDLKKAGEQHYTDYVALLDEQLALTTNSVFKEYGTNRTGVGGDLNAIVGEIRKSAPELTQEQAVIRAYQANPSLDPFTGKLG